MHSDDLADAILFLLQLDEPPFLINVGVGYDISIREVAKMIGDLAGFKGRIVFDSTKPDGMPKKLLDDRSIKNLGWRARISLESGLKLLIDEYRDRSTS
jgi:GDP-L-fucose synthase